MPLFNFRTQYRRKSSGNQLELKVCGEDCPAFPAVAAIPLKVGKVEEVKVECRKKEKGDSQGGQAMKRKGPEKAFLLLCDIPQEQQCPEKAAPEDQGHQEPYGVRMRLPLRQSGLIQSRSCPGDCEQDRPLDQYLMVWSLSNLFRSGSFFSGRSGNFFSSRVYNAAFPG
ncbi:MAG: hypothetical protein A4E72_00426 [Syntrophus sp. PtaU1.Bin208]|nr:MAG: hypothetical protein A4E72_00426 [Syntrophus sp. PtaU1.Bin208]